MASVHTPGLTVAPPTYQAVEMKQLQDDPSYAEYQQFKQFQSLFSKSSSVHSTPLHPSSTTQYQPPALYSPNVAHSTHPQWSAEQDEFHGFLSKQFPTVANPAPLGLCAFALTTFVLSMYNAGAWVNSEGPIGVVMGIALFYGGLVQLLAGMWEMRIGNTFGALAFSSYGGFWMGTAALFIQSFDFLGVYDGTDELNNALGIYWMAWTFFTFFMCISSHRTSVALFLLFFFLTLTFLLLTFLLLTIAQFLVDSRVHQAAGAFGILTSCIAWYAAFAGLLDKRQQSLFSLPVGDLRRMFPTREEREEEERRRVQRTRLESRTDKMV